MPKPWTMIIDFDGTITTRDADVVIAEALGDGRHREFIDQLQLEYEQLQISTAQYFHRYLERLQLSPDQFATQARAVPMRPGFGELVAWCESVHIDAHVASEGLDVYIAPILAAAASPSIPLTCNVARWDGAHYQVSPAPDGQSCARCLTCKGELTRRLQRAGHRVALVGNGASDLCGARHADLVLARDSLAHHCRRESIAHVEWSTFEHVRERLESHAIDPT